MSGVIGCFHVNNVPAFFFLSIFGFESGKTAQSDGRPVQRTGGSVEYCTSACVCVPDFLFRVSDAFTRWPSGEPIINSRRLNGHLMIFWRIPVKRIACCRYVCEVRSVETLTVQQEALNKQTVRDGIMRLIF